MVLAEPRDATSMTKLPTKPGTVFLFLCLRNSQPTLGIVGVVQMSRDHCTLLYSWKPRLLIRFEEIISAAALLIQGAV